VQMGGIHRFGSKIIILRLPQALKIAQSLATDSV
jgi:hypothetical protein